MPFIDRDDGRYFNYVMNFTGRTSTGRSVVSIVNVEKAPFVQLVEINGCRKYRDERDASLADQLIELASSDALKCLLDADVR